MLKFIIRLIIALGANISYGQYSPAEFEKLYKEVTIGKNNNINSGDKLAKVHTLLNKSELKTTEEKIKAYLILANLYNLQGDRATSIKYADEGRKLASEQSLHLWVSRFYGFKSSVYRKAEMHFLGQQELSKAIVSAKKAHPSKDLYIFNTNVYHEKAHYAMADGRFKDAMNDMKESNLWASKISDFRKEFFLASNYQYIGIIYNKINKPDSALLNLQMSLKLTGSSSTINTKTLRNYICNYIGEAYLKKNDFTQAKSFLDKVSGSELQYRTIDLNQELYSNLINYFQQHSNKDSLQIYQHKYDSISNLLLKSNATAVNSVTTELNQQNQLLKQKSQIYFWLVLMGAFGAAAYFLIIKRKKNVIVQTPKILNLPAKTPDKHITEGTMDVTKETMYVTEGTMDITESTTDITKKTVNIPNKTPNITTETTYNEAQVRNIPKETLGIAKETWNMLADKLAEFEKEQQFLNANVSATLLANQFQTNTKYVTFVIKKLYGQDFNSYINSLRIGYVSNLLRDDIKYRQYKIGFLAEISGYSSHSKFAAVFKKVNGISPSEFIAALKDN